MHVSPDGSTLIVAVSGSPKAGPGVDEKTLPPADRSRDGIALVDLARRSLKRTLPGGIDPESFDVSADGKTIYVSNEDGGTVTVLDVVSGTAVATVPVGGEPEGVTISPDGAVVYVTSEGAGTVSVIATGVAQGRSRRSRSGSARARSPSPSMARRRTSPTKSGASVSVVDAKRHKVKKTIALAGENVKPMGSAVSPDGARVYITTGRGGTLVAIDTKGDTVVASLAGREAPVGRRRQRRRQAHLHGERTVERRHRSRRGDLHRAAARAGRDDAVGHRDREVGATGGAAAPPKLGRNVIALSAVSFFTDVSSEMIYPLIPVFLTTVLGASASAVGIVEGAAESTAALLKLVSGWLSDRVTRRKPLVVAGYALASVVRPLIGLAQRVAQVAAIRVSDRIGKGIRTAPRDALIADSVDPSVRGRAFGFHRAADHAGAVVGPLIAFAVLRWEGVPLRARLLLRGDPGVRRDGRAHRVRARDATTASTTPGRCISSADSARASGPSSAWCSSSPSGIPPTPSCCCAPRSSASRWRSRRCSGRCSTW